MGLLIQQKDLERLVYPVDSWVLTGGVLTQLIAQGLFSILAEISSQRPSHTFLKIINSVTVL